MNLFELQMESPIGLVRLIATEDALAGIYLPEDRDARGARPGKGRSILTRAREQLAEYFAGRRTRFELELRLEGTAFQRAVWDALLAIPFGETRSYADIAAAIGRPRATRAVGGANGRNPIPIIVPCHRVIGRDGSLTGFSSGLAYKRWLLRHEGVGAWSETKLAKG